MGNERGKSMKKEVSPSPPPAPSAKPQTVEEKVNAWLANQGYHLEYKTYKAFRNANIPAQMSIFLESDGKPREIDVIGEVHERGTPSAVNVICECKYSAKNQPWVLLRSESRTSFPIEWHALPQTEVVKTLWAFTEKCQPDFEKTWHFARNAAFGQTLLEAMKDVNADVAYGAVQKVANAAWEYTSKPFVLGEGDPKDENVYRVVIPCIVVDSPLLMATFNHDKGEFESTQIPFGRLFWLGVNNGTIIDVVQKDSLTEYTKRLYQTMKYIDDCLILGREHKKNNPVG
jgi:hypothetical protein